MTTDLFSELLGELARRITAAVQPIKIIVFGSAARGEAGPNSDIDVLVVMPEGTHRRHTAQDLYQQLAGFPRAVDIIVATPADLERHRDTIGLVYRDALRDGKEIYAS